MIMKKITSTILIGASLLAVIPSSYASEDDCAIWLCLPTGFPDGCGKAKKAFLHRIKKFRPPLPNIASCLLKPSDLPPESREQYKEAIKSSSKMSYREGVAAKMPAGKYCVSYSRRSGRDGRYYCSSYEQRAEHYIDNVQCRHYRQSKDSQWIWKPYGCVGTYKWIDTYSDSDKYGERYYYTY